MLLVGRWLPVPVRGLREAKAEIFHEQTDHKSFQQEAEPLDPSEPAQTFLLLILPAVLAAAGASEPDRQPNLLSDVLLQLVL